MTTRREKATSIWRSILACALLMTVMLLVVQPAVADLPPRPQPKQPEPEPGDGQKTGHTRLGGGIMLRVEPAQAGLWAVVQWQDGLGGWHDVEGWQGALDTGQAMWFVSKEYLGKGPFRWVVYEAQESDALVRGEPLATSDAFYLPRTTGEVVSITVSPSP